MKRKTARELLAESLKELAEQKNIEKITIREITDNCGYSPATFYRYFKDKYDLIAWDYVRELEDTVGGIGRDDYTWPKALLRSAYYHQEHRDYLANLFAHTRGLYSFERYMAEANFKVLHDMILKKKGAIDKITERSIWVYCYGGVKNSSDWLLGKYEATPEEMAEIYERTLPAELRQYL
ncbi:MAG: TetR family transcriptional regulator [Erysipelotrichaceae bacterium]|nr:TetR family transcriptional regulator [Erysipelotrichaceae bacterium]